MKTIGSLKLTNAEKWRLFRYLRLFHPKLTSGWDRSDAMLFGVDYIPPIREDNVVSMRNMGKIKAKKYMDSLEIEGLKVVRDKMMFPNGFESWHETHFEIVQGISDAANTTGSKVDVIACHEGTGGLYELAKKLTDEFEEMNKGREWDGEFFDEVEEFINQKLY